MNKSEIKEVTALFPLLVWNIPAGGKDTDKNITATLKPRILPAFASKPTPEGWADVIILSGGKPIKDAEGDVIIQRLHGDEVAITLTKTRKRVKI